MSAKTITTQLSEALETIKTQEADLAQTNAANAEAKTAITDLTAKVTELTAERDAHAAQILVMEAAATELADALQDALADVEDLKTAAKTAAQVAGEQLGNIVAAPVENISTQTAKPTKAELWAQYSALPITQQRAFYLANQKEMDA